MNVTRIALLMSVLLAGSVIARQDPGKHITVYGTAQVDAAADRATVNFNIVGSGETLKASLAALDEQIQKVRDPLGKAGIAPGDISAVFLPGKGQQTISDFWSAKKVHRSQKKISVHVTEVDRLQEVLVALEGLGFAEDIRVMYHLTSLEDLKRVALEEAVTNAMEKALVISAKVGMTLGGVIRVEELVDEKMPEAPELTALFNEGTDDASTEITLVSRVKLIIAMEGS